MLVQHSVVGAGKQDHIGAVIDTFKGFLAPVKLDSPDGSLR